MIELKNDELVFRFPEVHPGARMTIQLQRTLRIPDDGTSWPLPPGLGCFPLRHVDDFAERVPARWVEHGGVMTPLHQAEALWLNFSASHIPGQGQYPFVVQVATGKIDAVTGGPWSETLTRAPQNYLVIPGQPWLDGYCVAKGQIRQFVAMPLGDGSSAEEQLTGEAEVGGMQIAVHPMRRDVFERRFPKRPPGQRFRGVMREQPFALCAEAPDMGLAPGGRMKQEIVEDEFDLDDWDRNHRSRCFVHLASSLVWRAITDEAPPQRPPTAAAYTKAGLPWFEHYSEKPAVDGSKILAHLKSVVELGREKRTPPLVDEVTPRPTNVVTVSQSGEVREGMF